jgi:hypothetical protein
MEMISSGFITAVFCKCGTVIAFPPPIPRELAPNQILSRWKTDPINVACLVCKRVYEHPVDSFHWHELESMGLHQAYNEMATYRLVVQCDQMQCSGLIDMLLVDVQDLNKADGVDRARMLYAMGIKCSQKHVHSMKLIGASVAGFYEDKVTP